MSKTQAWQESRDQDSLKSVFDDQFLIDRAWDAVKVLENVDLRLSSFSNELSSLHPHAQDNFLYSTVNEHIAYLAVQFVQAEYYATNGAITTKPSISFMQQWVDNSVLKDGSFYLGTGFSSTSYAHTVFANKSNDSYAKAAYAQGHQGDLAASVANLEAYGAPISGPLESHWSVEDTYNKQLWGAVKEADNNKSGSLFHSGNSPKEPLPEGLPPVKGLPPYSADAHQVEKLVEFYIGFFGRAAEYSGLEHHKGKLIDLLNSGLTEDQAFSEIANDFWQAGKEYSHMTGFSEQTSSFDFIAKVYENVLGRPDAVQHDREGVEFWTQVMQDSGASHGEMVLKVLNGAYDYMDENPQDHITAYVGSLLDNRTEVSLFFSQETISGDLFGNEAIQAGWDVINRIDQNVSSVDQVKNALENNTLLDLPEINLVGTGGLMLDEGFMM